MNSSDPSKQGVHVRIDARGLASVRLEDGRAVNVLSRRRLAALARSLEKLAAGAHPPRALILEGNALGSFAAGADLREIATLDAQEALELSREGARVMELLSGGPWPTGSLVDGHALGGGCDLALACDLVASTPRSVFVHPGIARGFFTGWGGSARIPGRSAAGAARALFLGGEAEPARRLHDAGLLSYLGAPGPARRRLEARLLLLAAWPRSARDAARHARNETLSGALVRLASAR